MGNKFIITWKTGEVTEDKEYTYANKGDLLDIFEMFIYGYKKIYFFFIFLLAIVKQL